MSDYMEFLRTWAAEMVAYVDGPSTDALVWAVNEIEQLRAALKEISTMPGDSDNSFRARHIALAALRASRGGGEQ